MIVNAPAASPYADTLPSQCRESSHQNNKESRSPAGLSGGEKQRVQLARVIAQIWSDDYSKKILILDEPTSYLDIKHQYLLFKFLKELNQKGLTIVMVLHDLNHALSNSNKIAVLKDSKLISYGKTKNIISEELIKNVFEIDLKLINYEGSKTPIIF